MNTTQGSIGSMAAHSRSFSTKHDTCTESGKKSQVVIKHHKKTQTGCVACKTRHIKCGEERPSCKKCTKEGFECNYAPRESRTGKFVSQRPHTKSRAGCIICKARRVKCDENRPSCGWCMKTGNQCRYEIQDPIQPQGLRIGLHQPIQRKTSGIPNLKLNIVPGTNRERRSFEFYVLQLGPMLACSFDAAFWNQILIQRSCVDPALWHSLVAVSMLLESKVTDHKESHCVGLQYYNKAVRNLALSNARGRLETENPIMASIVFWIIEEIIQDAEKADIHLHSGIKMIESWKAENPSRPAYQRDLVEDLLEPIFDHMKSMSLMHAGHVSLELLKAEVHAFAKTITPSSCDPDALVFAATSARKLELSLQVSDWIRSFDDTLARPSRIDPAEEEQDGVALIKFRHKLLTISIDNILCLGELGYDNYMREFQEAIEYAEVAGAAMLRRGPKLATSLLPSDDECPMLFSLASKCRNPQLRRRSLELMKKTSGLPAFQVDDLWIKIAQRVIELEEKGMEDLLDLTGAIVPSDWSRIYEIKIVPEASEAVEERRALMSYKQSSGVNQEPLKWIQEYVTY